MAAALIAIVSCKDKAVSEQAYFTKQAWIPLFSQAIIFLGMPTAAG